MVTAIEDAYENMDTNYNHVMKINAFLREELSFLPILSPSELYSPYILTVSVKPWPSEVFTRMLYTKGFCVSSGSACSNTPKQKSQGVLLSMNVHPLDAKSSLRLSFSGETTIEEAGLLASAIHSTFKELT
jgi:cysteine desulfurase